MNHVPGATVPGDVEIDREASLEDDVESVRSDLTSITESIYNYVYENGRTYHAYRPGTYFLPNDEKEQERLDLLHHVFRLCLDGKLCQTELEHPQSVLDIGTGTGIWAIEIADEFPSAQVVGVDLSPIQPAWVPPNVRFIIDDVNQDWSFPVNSFDFIHIRGLAGSLEDWPTFLRRCYDHLKPGGRIEVSECRARIECDDSTFPEECYTRTWIDEFNRISHAQGRFFDIFPEIPGLLEGASFDKVNVAEYICPVGTWPKDPRLKEIGRFFRVQVVDAGVDSYSLALFTRYGGWKPDEVQILLAHVRSELKKNKMHIYTHCSFAVAQKPL